MSDRENLYKGLSAILDSAMGANAKTEATKAFRRLTVRHKMANTQANVVLAEEAIFTADSNVFTDGFKVLSAKVLPAVNVTSSGSNNYIFTLGKRDGAGGTRTNVAKANTNTTANSGTGDLVVYVPASFTLTANAVECAANSVLTLQGEVTGNGANVSSAVVEIVLEAL